MVLQFVLFVAFVFEVKPMRILFPIVIFWIGVFLLVFGGLITLVAILQLNVHLSPFPSPLPGSRLIVNGVYKLVRHPIYTGIMMAFFGFAIIDDSGYKLIVAALLSVLFYFKSIYEEKRMMKVYPDYAEYKQRTGRFSPKLR